MSTRETRKLARFTMVLVHTDWVCLLQRNTDASLRTTSLWLLSSMHSHNLLIHLLADTELPVQRVQRIVSRLSSAWRSGLPLNSTQLGRQWLQHSCYKLNQNSGLRARAQQMLSASMLGSAPTYATAAKCITVSKPQHAKMPAMVLASPRSALMN